MRNILAVLTVCLCIDMSAYANGGKKEASSGVVEAQSVPLEKTLEDTTQRDKLITYLLTHADIPNQQVLLSRLLRDKEATSQVITEMPREHRDAFSMIR